MTTEELTVPDEFDNIPEGYYLCRTTEAHDVPEKEYVAMQYDIAAGPFTGYYTHNYSPAKTHSVYLSYHEYAADCGNLEQRLTALDMSNHDFNAADFDRYRTSSICSFVNLDFCGLIQARSPHGSYINANAQQILPASRFAVHCCDPSPVSNHSVPSYRDYHQNLIYEDNMQRIGAHKNIHDYFYACGLPVHRCYLNVGDYTCAQSMVAVDTKRSFSELIMNLFDPMDSVRFEQEIIRARDSHTLLVVLIEASDIPDITCGHDLNPNMRFEYDGCRRCNFARCDMCYSQYDLSMCQNPTVDRQLVTHHRRAHPVVATSTKRISTCQTWPLVN